MKDMVYTDRKYIMDYFHYNWGSADTKAVLDASCERSFL